MRKNLRETLRGCVNIKMRIEDHEDGKLVEQQGRIFYKLLFNFNHDIEITGTGALTHRSF